MEESRLRIEAEYGEIQSHPSDHFACGKLKWDTYEWQFGIQCPSGTEYEGGIYHGMIRFPTEYPSKPPSFVFLTKNGRFKTRNKIRISRLDDWQPSWGVRYALNALIDEMPTYPDGGSVEYSKKRRREWARRSRAAGPKCSPPERQKLVDEIHNYLLSKSPHDPVPSQNHRAKRKHGTGGTGSSGGESGSVVNVIGNSGTPSDHETEFRTFVPKSLMEESRRLIEAEYIEIESHPSDYFAWRVDVWNPHEWLFGIGGPNGTEYQVGIYHGQIHFPKEYPSKPPSFIFLTANGRFKTRIKIRISRLDDWQPSWGVRYALNALIDEMATYPDGGSVEYSKKQRREWASRCRAAAPKCSPPERQKLVEEIHNYLLSKSPHDPVPSQNHRAKRKHGTGGTGSSGGDNGSGVIVIGNIINAINSTGVGILDFMNEASNPKKAKLDDHV